MHGKQGPAVYDAVAIALHWSIALLIIAAIVVGEVMPETGARGQLYALHASFGFVVLLLSVVRLGWRVSRLAPDYPAAMPGWQKALARAVSVAFYVLMIALPLTGWLGHSAAAVSTPFFRNSDIFGVLPVPIVPFVGLKAPLVLRAPALNAAHELSNNVMILLVLLHAGAALKHHFLDRDDILKRMLPRGPRR